MKKNSFIDFILKNRYIILFVTIVLVLAVVVFLVLLAIYLGKRIQEDDAYIKKMFRDKDDVVYKVKDDEE